VISSDIDSPPPECLVTDCWSGSTVVVRCVGVLDMVTAPHLEERLDVVLDKRPAVIIIDLSAVDFLASAGMNALVMVHRRLTADQIFAVVADGPATSRPLRLIGLAEMFNMCPTLDAAYEKAGVQTAL